jgi:hypothetical protein
MTSQDLASGLSRVEPDEGRHYFRRLLPPRPDIFAPFV